MRKPVAICLLFFTLLLPAFSQTYETMITELQNKMITEDWFSSFLIIHNMLHAYPEKKYEISKYYNEAYIPYMYFENIEDNITKIKEEKCDEFIDIKSIVFTGSGGCIGVIPVNINIEITDLVKIKSDSISLSIKKDKFAVYLLIYNKVLRNCKESYYGIAESTSDLHGDLVINYLEENKLLSTSYKISFGYIDNIYMYLAMYATLLSENILLE